MSEKPKPPSGQRFTMLEPKGPNTTQSGSESWPVVELQLKQRFTLLEPRGPVPPLTPEELAAPVARGFSDPPASAPDDTLPLPVRAAFEELAFALRSLSAAERGAALDYIAAELPKRTAG